MKFAIFAARTHIGGQRMDEIRINVPTQGRFIQIDVVDAADDRTKAGRDKFTDHVACIHLLNWENAAPAELCQVFLAPALEVFEENIAKDEACASKPERFSLKRGAPFGGLGFMQIHPAPEPQPEAHQTVRLNLDTKNTTSSIGFRSPTSASPPTAA
jgi:hypothetical protein